METKEYLGAIDLSPYPRPAVIEGAERDEALDTLLKFLMRERGLIAAYSASYEKKLALVRAKMNSRPPIPVPQDILAMQDRIFWTETLGKGIVRAEDLTFGKYDLALWEGDITRLGLDAIVNAANRELLGCFLEGHRCIDNAIHSAAGMQLRADCNRIVSAAGHEEENGSACITRGYNLPSSYVIHTVGPMVGRTVTEEDRADLSGCYTSVLDLCEEMDLHSVAFCCVATGVFNFPADEAAEIATGTVLRWKLRHADYPLRVVFNTFRPRDTAIYRSILSML